MDEPQAVRSAPIDSNETPAAWAETWDLVGRAAETIDSNESRLAALEAQNRELEREMAGEVRALRARIEAAERLAERAEAARADGEERAERAEERAASAERWLARIDVQVRQIPRT